MVIIPERKTVLLLVPKAASKSLKAAVLARYPSAFMLYRHMEADGIPKGYDTWTKIGVIRNPIDRLWSLFNFLKTLSGPYDADYIERMRHSVANVSFSDWVLGNNEVFTSPYAVGSVQPEYMVNHAIPENRKSQHFYLRPDLGTKVYPFERLGQLSRDLDLVSVPHINRAPKANSYDLTFEAQQHIQKYFAWDFEYHAQLTEAVAA
ncbi:sulfotransferase family protein [Aestuariibacter halophilus]|uniref:Sulfotransferase family protein n=1 Tax=Fluctibacter halophilus TaxID=226011 RepID=A0ABS8G640_9ALTE|nr:sulfotransferase family protein [Aestuariibacter halophilus]MCC2615973.1 sulfotransferase family protein [Aestuariibacter halophilus]